VVSLFFEGPIQLKGRLHFKKLNQKVMEALRISECLMYSKAENNG
jgi:hypothetical protein